MLECSQSSGFIAFKEIGDQIFISDCYTHPDFRQEGVGSRMLAEVESIARARGKKLLVTHIDLATQTCGTSLLAQLHVGFVPFKAEAGIIWLKKEVKHGESC